MKRISLYLLLACIAIACQKEDELTNRIDHRNLYAITDDATDSIQHKRFELYTTYGVPVYFNDTIEKIFIKVDISGDSVFRYETLDLNWAFNTTNQGTVTYKTTPLTTPDLQMKALRFTEIFLKNTQAALYPHAIWLTKDCHQISSSQLTTISFLSRYRNLIFSNFESLKEEEMESTSLTYRNQLVETKLGNYEEELKLFHAVVDEKSYNQDWSTFYPDEEIPTWMGPRKPWTARALAEEYNEDPGASSFMGTFRNEMTKYGKWTDEQVDEYILYSRELVGRQGFVYFDKNYGIYYTPRNKQEDLELYLREMMKYPRKEFLSRWNHCPLVIKKYEILYAIIRDELGVEL